MSHVRRYVCSITLLMAISLLLAASPALLNAHARATAGSDIETTTIAALSAFSVESPVAAIPGDVSDHQALVWLRGEVRYAEGDAGANLSLELIRNGAVQAGTITDDAGRFDLGQLAGGDYAVRASNAGQPLELLDGAMLHLKPGTDAPVYLIVARTTAPDPAAQLRSAPAADNGRISGQVTAADTGEGLKGVSVQIYDAVGNYITGISTIASGYYTTTAMLATGSYRVEFETRYSSDNVTRAYLGEYYDNQPDLANADVVTVTAPDTTTSINAVLERGGQISGRVTADDTGDGLANVDVRVYNSSSFYSSASLVRTDATGVYTVTGLQSGSYLVEFDPPSSGTASAYLGEWYNDQPDREVSNLVPVTLANTTGNINAGLARGGQISGQVTGDGEAGLDDIRVYVYDSCGNSVLSTTTNQDGNYTTPSLPAGNYQIWFAPESFTQAASKAYLGEWYNNKTDLDTADTVAVTAGNVTSTINAQLARGGQISGLVTGDGGTPQSNGQVKIYDSTGLQVASVSIGSDGSYITAGLPAGTYSVLFDLFSSSEYVDQWYNNKNSRTEADPVTVTVGNVTSTINAQLARGGQISGLVTAEDGTPLADANVTIYSSSNSWINSAQTDADGTYVVKGLLAGSYRLLFAPPASSAYVKEWYNNKLDRNQGDLVSVTLGNETSGINAQLAPGGQISGQVTTEDGTPLENVAVTIYTSDGDYLASTNTNVQGGYISTGLRDGSYRVNFNSTLTHVGEYYNNKTSSDTADLVAVTVGNVTSGIDAQLARGGLIRGRVMGDGCPLRSVMVRVWPIDGNRTVSAPSTSERGYYTTSAVPGGSYHVEFVPSSSGLSTVKAYLDEYYNGKASRETADPVSVTVTEVTGNINASLTRGGSISGRVTAADTGTGLANVRVRIYDANGDRLSYVDTGSDGTYTTPGLSAGSYRLFFEPRGGSGAYIAEYYNDKTDLASADVLTLSASPVTGINAELARGIQFTGRVLRSNARFHGAAVSQVGIGDVRVSVLNSTGQSVASATTDDTGDYATAPGVGNGSYQLRFTPPEGSDLLPFTSSPINVTVGTPVDPVEVTLDQGALIYLPLLVR